MTYRDEFDDPPHGGGGFLASVGPKAAFFVVLIALSFMIGVVWKLYAGGTTPQNIPIVRADDAPFKVTPDDPGGMDIPHKDSTIFSVLKSEREEAGGEPIENLLADNNNEDPMPRSQLFAGLNTDKNPDLGAAQKPSPLDKPVGEIAQDLQKKADAIEKAVNTPAPQPVPESEPTPVVDVPKKIEPVAPVKPEPASKPKPKSQPKPQPQIEPKTSPASTLAPASGDYYIQLGSVKTKLGAEKEWKKIVAKYPAQLSGFSHRVEMADLGAKGIFYRIQAGPTPKDKATATCTAIKKITPGACLVKKK